MFPPFFYGARDCLCPTGVTVCFPGLRLRAKVSPKEGAEGLQAEELGGWPGRGGGEQVGLCPGARRRSRITGGGGLVLFGCILLDLKWPRCRQDYQGNSLHKNVGTWLQRPHARRLSHQDGHQHGSRGVQGREAGCSVAKPLAGPACRDPGRSPPPGLPLTTPLHTGDQPLCSIPIENILAVEKLEEESFKMKNVSALPPRAPQEVFCQGPTSPGCPQGTT